MTTQTQWAPTAIGLVYDGAASDLMALRGQHSENEVSRLSAIKSKLGDNARLLDVGCGFGRDVHWFRCHGVEAIGIDPSSGMLSISEIYGKLPLFKGDLLSVPIEWTGVFDCCWCNGVFFHISPELQPVALKTLRDLVRLNGLIYLQTSRGKGTSLRRICDTNWWAPYSFLSTEDIVAIGGQLGLELEHDFSTDRDQALLFRSIG